MTSEKHSHPLKNLGPTICACCGNTIYSGLENVFTIKRKADPRSGISGKVDEMGKYTELKDIESDIENVNIHARCAFPGHSDVRIECEKCGTFSRATNVKLTDGRTVGIRDVCRCTCHYPNFLNDCYLADLIIKDGHVKRTEEKDNEILTDNKI